MAAGRVFVQGSPDRGFSIGELAVYVPTLGPGPHLGREAFSSRMPQSLHCYGAQIVQVCSTQMAQTSRDERQGLPGNTT